MEEIEYFKGIAMIKGDTHFNKWIRETGRLDHDSWLLSRILKYCKPGSTVIDAGAMWGDHSIAYSRAVGQEGLVLAFEPNPMAFKCLEHNTASLCNVHLIPFGLSDKEETFGLSIESENYGMANLQGEGDTPCMPLDQLIDTIRNLSFAKIDTEGFELKFLNGAIKTITKHRPVMLIEMNRATFARQNVLYEDIFSFLRTLNYEFENVDEASHMEADQYDLICKPE